MTTQENRLAEIRSAIEAENVSYGEIAELQDMAAESPELFADDPLLAEWAGIPEEQLRSPAKHTPGPWSLGIETDDDRAQVINNDGWHVAYVACDPLEANARLIAAAPDLLAALETIAAGNTDPDGMVRIAAEALSKAEGEQ